jgi:hypothetical protein
MRLSLPRLARKLARRRARMTARCAVRRLLSNSPAGLMEGDRETTIDPQRRLTMIAFRAL